MSHRLHGLKSKISYNKIRVICGAFFFLLSCYKSFPGDTCRFFQKSEKFNSVRFAGIISSEMTLSGAAFIGLNNLWYNQYPRSSFHFFDDNSEWLQMDKTGHLFAAYYLGKISIDLLHWSGMKRKKAILYGGAIGAVLITSVEVFDGFSTGWGASTGDIAANIAGAALATTQQLKWNEQRILLKYSFLKSEYASYRPEALGNGIAEELIKDYNGQIYWMSVNIFSFFRKKENGVSPSVGLRKWEFPKWINIAIGYGANGMLGAINNEGVDKPIPQFERYRQYYLSLDIDLSRIPVKPGLVKTILSALNFIKIPFPALEFNNVKGVEFHPIYF